MRSLFYIAFLFGSLGAFAQNDAVKPVVKPDAPKFEKDSARPDVMLAKESDIKKMDAVKTQDHNKTPLKPSDSAHLKSKKKGAKTYAKKKLP